MKQTSGALRWSYFISLCILLRYIVTALPSSGAVKVMHEPDL